MLNDPDYMPNTCQTDASNPFHPATQVGRSGQKHPFMSYTDPNTLLHVTWYGYSTGWGASGEWMFPGMAPPPPACLICETCA